MFIGLWGCSGTLPFSTHCGVCGASPWMYRYMCNACSRRHVWMASILCMKFMPWLGAISIESRLHSPSDNLCLGVKNQHQRSWISWWWWTVQGSWPDTYQEWSFTGHFLADAVLIWTVKAKTSSEAKSRWSGDCNSFTWSDHLPPTLLLHLWSNSPLRKDSHFWISGIAYNLYGQKNIDPWNWPVHPEALRIATHVMLLRQVAGGFLRR